MISLQLRNLLRRVQSEHCLRNISLTPYQRSDDESDKENKKIQAKNKLNSLLQSIIKDESLSKERPKIMETAPEALAESKAKKKMKIKQKEKPKDLGEKIAEAAKEVATSIKGDPSMTEAEILHKLLYKNKKLEESVVRASGNENLSVLLSAMKIESEQPQKRKVEQDTKFSRADQVRSALGTVPFKTIKYPTNIKRVNLFSGQPLGWFKVDKATEHAPALPTWEFCEKRELKLKVTVPPANYWEQLIAWTNKGILWKFPIDNEQGMDEEKKIDFADHVFLENYLEDWCPNIGPIRHFMELVCVGLSRNHWLTAAEKKAHIMWYKDYFSEKKELIKEIGAGEIMEAPSSQEART